jgi:hypothetical protein
MPEPDRRNLYARAGVGLAVVGAAVASFSLTRPQEDRPPTPTTTTTFPRAAYVDTITSTLQARVDAPLDEAGSRCIGDALVTVLGDDALHDLAERPDPLAELLPVERDQVLRIVVTCLDPAVAEALLGGGVPDTQAPVTLPDEDG